MTEERSHVVISGIGRCGTTFLVELFTHLGLDTGWDVDELSALKSKICHAGLERDIRLPDCPYVVKNPWFCLYAEEVLSRGDIRLDHVFVLMRDLGEAAESRRQVVRRARAEGDWSSRIRAWRRPDLVDGGLWKTRSMRAGVQERVLAGIYYSMMLSLSSSEVQMTLLRYPELVRNPRYLYSKIRPILFDISYPDFEKSYLACMDPNLVHTYVPVDTSPEKILI